MSINVSNIFSFNIIFRIYLAFVVFELFCPLIFGLNLIGLLIDFYLSLLLLQSSIALILYIHYKHLSKFYIVIPLLYIFMFLLVKIEPAPFLFFKVYQVTWYVILYLCIYGLLLPFIKKKYRLFPLISFFFIFGLVHSLSFLISSSLIANLLPFILFFFPFPLRVESEIIITTKKSLKKVMLEFGDLLISSLERIYGKPLVKDNEFKFKISRIKDLYLIVKISRDLKKRCIYFNIFINNKKYCNNVIKISQKDKNKNIKIKLITFYEKRIFLSLFSLLRSYSFSEITKDVLEKHSYKIEKSYMKIF